MQPQIKFVQSSSLSRPHIQAEFGVMQLISLSRFLVWLRSPLFTINSMTESLPTTGETHLFLAGAFKPCQLTNRIIVFWENLSDCQHKREKLPQKISRVLLWQTATHSIVLPSNLAVQHCLPPLLLFIYFACYLSPSRSCLGLPPRSHIALYLLFKLFIKERGRQERNCGFVMLLVSPCKLLLQLTAGFVSRYDWCAALLSLSIMTKGKEITLYRNLFCLASLEAL